MTLKMILEITLTNFFSLNEKVTLDLQAANIQTKEARALADNTFTVGNERLLKTVAIYGADFLIDGGATASFFYGPLNPEA